MSYTTTRLVTSTSFRKTGTPWSRLIGRPKLVQLKENSVKRPALYPKKSNPEKVSLRLWIGPLSKNWGWIQVIVQATSSNPDGSRVSLPVIPEYKIPKSALYRRCTLSFIQIASFAGDGVLGDGGDGGQWNLCWGSQLIHQF